MLESWRSGDCVVYHNRHIHVQVPQEAACFLGVFFRKMTALGLCCEFGHVHVYRYLVYTCTLHVYTACVYMYIYTY